MLIHYRYSVVLGTSEGPKRIPRLACDWVRRDSPALKYADIMPSSITCKRCLSTWTVRNHIAAVLRMSPEMRAEELIAK